MIGRFGGHLEHDFERFVAGLGSHFGRLGAGFGLMFGSKMVFGSRMELGWSKNFGNICLKFWANVPTVWDNSPGVPASGDGCAFQSCLPLTETRLARRIARSAYNRNLDLEFGSFHFVMLMTAHHCVSTAHN